MCVPSHIEIPRLLYWPGREMLEQPACLRQALEHGSSTTVHSMEEFPFRAAGHSCTQGSSNTPFNYWLACKPLPTRMLSLSVLDICVLHKTK